MNMIYNFNFNTKLLYNKLNLALMDRNYLLEPFIESNFNQQYYIKFPLNVDKIYIFLLD